MAYEHFEQAFLETVLDTVDALVVVGDQDGSIIAFNRACETLTGCSFEEVRGRHTIDFIPAGERRPVVEAFLAGRFPYRHENHWLTADGGRRLIDWTNDVLRDADGRITHYVSTGIDITERRAAEQRMRDYARVVETAGSAIVFTDADMIITGCNVAAEKLYGYARDELIGQPSEILDMPGYEAEAADLRALIRQGAPVEFDAVRRHKDGSRVLISLTVSSIVDANGRIVGWSSIAHDIADRKQAEQELLQGRERLRRQVEVAGRLAASTVLQEQGLDAALREVAEQTGQALEVDRFVLWELQAGGEMRSRLRYDVPTAGWLEPLTVPAEMFLSIYDGSEPAGPFVVHDTTANPRVAPLRESDLEPLGTAAILETAVRMRGRFAGFVTVVQRGAPRRWTEQEISFVSHIADAVARLMGADESNRLQAEIAARQTVLTSMMQASVQLAGSQTYEEHGLTAALDEVTRTVSRTLRIGRAGVWLLDPERSRARTLSRFWLDEDAHQPALDMDAEMFRAAYSVSGPGEVGVVDDIEADARLEPLRERYFREFDIAALLFASIWRAGEFVGALTVGALGGPHEWSTEEQSFVAYLAGHVSRLLEVDMRRLAERRISDSHARISRQLELAGELAGSDAFEKEGLRAALDDVCRSAVRELAVTRCAIWLYDAERDLFRQISRYDAAEGAGGELLERPAGIFRLLTDGHSPRSVVTAPDVRTDPRFAEVGDAYYAQRGIIALAEGGIWRDSRLVGLITVAETGGPRQWEPEDESLLGYLARHVAGLLEADERRRAEAALQSSEERLRHQLRVAGEITRSSTYDEQGLEAALAELAESARKAFASDRAVIWRYRPESESFERIAFNAAAGTRGEPRPVLPAAGFLQPYVSMGPGSVLAIDDAATDPRIEASREERFTRLGLKALLAAPFWRSDEFLGVLSIVQLDGARHWTSEEQALSSYLANHIARLLEIDDRRRAEAALQAGEERLRRQIELAGNVTRSTTYDERGLVAALNEIAEAAQQAFGGDRATIWRYDPSGDVFHWAAFASKLGPRHEPPAELPAYEYSHAPPSANPGTVLAVDDTVTDPRYEVNREKRFLRFGVRAILSAPFWRSDEFLGVLTVVQHHEPRSWTSEEQTLASYLANHVARLLEIDERRSAQAALRASEERLRRQIEVAGNVTRSTAYDQHGLDAALEEIAEAALQAFACKRAVIWRYNEAANTFRAAAFAASDPSQERPRQEAPAERFVQDYLAMGPGSVLKVDDTATDPRFEGERERRFLRFGLTAMLGAPFWRSDEFLGVLSIMQTDGPRSWTGEEQALASYLANHIARLLEIDDRRRAETALQASEERLRRQVAATGRLIRSSRLETEGLEAALQEITAEAAACLGCEMAVVWQRTDDAREFRPRAPFRTSTDIPPPLDSIPEEIYLSGYDKVRHDDVVAIEDLATDPRTELMREERFIRFGITAMLAAPFWRRGRMAGTISCFTRGGPRGWTREDQAFVGYLAGQVLRLIETDERRRAEAALQSSEERLRHQLDVAGTITRSSAYDTEGLEAALREITMAAAEACGADRATVWIYDADTDAFTPHATHPAGESSGWPQAQVPASMFVAPAQSSQASDVIVITDTASDPLLEGFREEGFLRYGVRSMLAAPYWREGRLGGSLTLVSTSGRREWSQDEQALASYLAGHIARLIEIDSRRRAEAELRESEELFRLALEAAPIPLLIVTDGLHVFANERAHHAFGAPAGGLIGRASRDSYVDAADQQRAAEQMAREGRVEGFETEFQRFDGSRFWVSLAVRRFRYQGRPSLFAGFVDITDRRRTQEQLVQAQKMEAVGQLTGGIAHDFNNLLAVVIGNLELLAEELQHQEPLHDLATRAIAAAERGATLTQRLLAFSRRQVLAPQPVDVRELLGSMNDLLRRSLGEMIDIEVVSDAGLWTCTADPAQLEQSILNLAINARDAMGSRGKLTVEAANARLTDSYVEDSDIAPGQYVMIAVTDTGSGIPEDIRPHIFEPFFTTKDVGKGSGLGLSMVFGFVKQSNGHITVYSEPGEGTTFKIYLPRTAPAATATAVEQLAEETLPDGAGAVATVLLVEDDAALRQLTARMLGDLGYRVLRAASGPEALQTLRTRGPVDLLFTDVMLPGGITGRDLAGQAVQVQPDLPVLYMSGYSENVIVHQGRLDGSVVLIQKPFRRSDLVRKLEQVLGGRSA